MESKQSDRIDDLKSQPGLGGSKQPCDERTGASDSHAAISLQNQQQSPLLRLPPELRNKVYNYVLGVRFMNVASYGTYRDGNPWDSPDFLNERSLKHFQALTKTCSQLHTETTLLPFILNVFRVDTIFTLLRFASSLTERQRGAIRSVQIDIWMPDDLYRLRDLVLLPSIKYEVSHYKDKSTMETFLWRFLQQFPGIKRLSIGDYTYGFYVMKRWREAAASGTVPGIEIEVWERADLQSS